MGLFDIFKKKNPANKIPSPPPFVKPSTPPPPFHGFNSQKPIIKKEVQTIKKEQFLKDFFNIDISAALPDGFMELEKPELGIFTKLHYNAYNGNMQFLSNSAVVSPELRRFIDACARTFGATKGGDSVFTTRDYALLSHGVFARLWKDVWIDMSLDSLTGKKFLCITIFNTKNIANLKLG